MQVTCVEPIGNILPGAGVHSVPDVITPPIAIGSGYDMALPTLEDALCIMSDMSENLGIIFSCFMLDNLTQNFFYHFLD